MTRMHQQKGILQVIALMQTQVEELKFCIYSERIPCWDCQAYFQELQQVVPNSDGAISASRKD